MLHARWQQSTLRGGGFIAGLLQNPQRPDILYARSDVAGIFKSKDRGKSWQPCNHGLTDYHQHDTRSFAISPHDSQVLFRGSGSVRGQDFFGTLHKSTDGGDSWFPVCRAVDFYGNGESRQYGEVIQIHPQHSDWVIAGGYSKGVWLSQDGGVTWRCLGLVHERIGCVYFHPTEPQTVYVGTIGSYDRDPLYVAQQYDYVRPHPARLYCSRDLGATWTILHEGVDFAEMVFDPTNSSVLHAACALAGVLKSNDGGKTWAQQTLSKYEIGTLTIDPHNPRRLYAAAGTFPNYDPTVPPIGVYTSDDGGTSWSLVHWHLSANLLHYPAYMELPYAGWAIAKIRVDVQNSRMLYITNWYGVAISTDGGVNWDAHDFAGMENVCIENMTTHPTDPQTVYMVLADHSPKVSYDGGGTFATLPRPPLAGLGDSTAVVASRFRADFVLYAVKGKGGCALVRVEQNAEPCVVLQLAATPDTAPSRLALQSRAAGVAVQALAEDPFQAGTFYAYLDGILAEGAGIYVTTDWGDHWECLANPFPAYMRRVPYQREWIENELLSVVIAQTKNVCGTNQLLAVDPYQRATLYVGEWTEGLFCSTDGGVTWHSIGRDLPFKHAKAAVLNILRCDPQHAGRLYAGFIREGVWRSDDYGTTWRKIFPLDGSCYNATTLDIADEGWLVVASEPLYWSPCASTIYVSTDEGATWQNIYDPHLGAIRWKTVTFAAGQRKLYAGSCGNSAFHITLEVSS